MRLAKLFALLSGLSGTDRFTNAKLIHRESVLEHTGGVVLICYLLVTEMHAIEPHSIDRGQTLSKAAVHDVEEMLTGDIPRVTKYASDEIRAMFRKMERWAVKQITLEMDLSYHARNLFTADHFDAKNDPTGCIVELADTLAVVYTVNSEVVERGNLTMMSRATSCRDQLVRMKVQTTKQRWSDPIVQFLHRIIDQANMILDEAEDKARVTPISEKMSNVG